MAHRRLALISLLLGVMFLGAKQAEASAVPSYASLESLIESCDAVVVGKRQADPDNRSPLVHLIKIERVFYGTDAPRAGSFLAVEDANKTLWEQIGRARRQKKPVPIPIIPTYKSSLKDEEIRNGITAIFFLKKNNRKAWAYVVDSAYESLDSENEVKRLLSDRSKKSNGIQ